MEDIFFKQQQIVINGNNHDQDQDQDQDHCRALLITVKLPSLIKKYNNTECHKKN